MEGIKAGSGRLTLGAVVVAGIVFCALLGTSRYLAHPQNQAEISAAEAASASPLIGVNTS